MASYKHAEIRRGSRRVRADVTVDVDIDSYMPVTGPEAGVAQWSGVLRPPNNIGLTRGEVYSLLLPGHSPAKIRILDDANPIDASVPFQGIGRMPFAQHKPAAT